MNLSDVNMEILLSTATPFSVLEALFRSDTMTRYKFSKLPTQVPIERTPGRIRFSTGIKFLILVSSAPVLNIISVILSLERINTLSFDQAGIGALAFAVQPGLPEANVQNQTTACQKIPFEDRKEKREIVLSTFSVCRSSVTPSMYESQRPSEFTGTLSSVEVLADEYGFIGLTVRTPNASSIQKRYVEFDSEGRVFRVGQNLTLAQARQLAVLGAAELIRVCEGRHLTDQWSEDAARGRVSYLRWVDCSISIEDESQTEGIAFKVSERTTLVNADQFRVYLAEGALDDEDPVRYESPGAFPLIRRTRSYLSLPLLAIVVLSTTFLRVFVKLLLNNDVALAVEIFVKDRFNLPVADSFLNNEDDVEFLRVGIGKNQEKSWRGGSDTSSSSTAV